MDRVSDLLVILSGVLAGFEPEVLSVLALSGSTAKTCFRRCAARAERISPTFSPMPRMIARGVAVQGPFQLCARPEMNVDHVPGSLQQLPLRHV